MSFFRILEYLRYRWKAGNAYSIHSPFVYDFYNQVLKRKYPSLENEKEIKARYLQNNSPIQFEDPKTKKVFKTTVKALSQKTWSGRSFSYFLIKLCEWLSVSTLLETGTALGLNISMVSQARGMKQAVSIEGSEILVEQASALCLHPPNVELKIVQGNIYEVFAETLKAFKPEIVFLDADHRSEAIQFYLEEIEKHSGNVKAIVIHDIYWSRDMKNVWMEIIKDHRFLLTIDCFHAGIIFFSEQMEKQHFILKY